MTCKQILAHGPRPPGLQLLSDQHIGIKGLGDRKASNNSPQPPHLGNIPYIEGMSRDRTGQCLGAVVGKNMHVRGCSRVRVTVSRSVTVPHRDHV